MAKNGLRAFQIEVSECIRRVNNQPPEQMSGRRKLHHRQERSIIWQSVVLSKTTAAWSKEIWGTLQDQRVRQTKFDESEAESGVRQCFRMGLTNGQQRRSACLACTMQASHAGMEDFAARLEILRLPPSRVSPSLSSLLAASKSASIAAWSIGRWSRLVTRSFSFLSLDHELSSSFLSRCRSLVGAFR